MSNLYFNIRFFSWFLQIGKDKPYVSINKSDYWTHYYSSTLPKPKESWFKIYAVFGKFIN